jgi:hypothetical protein
MTQWRWLCLAGGLLVAASCGSSDESGGTGGAPATGGAAGTGGTGTGGTSPAAHGRPSRRSRVGWKCGFRL